MQFEPRFSSAAEAYRAFRPAYPPELFDRILAGVPRANRRRALDLGAGTGLSTLPLCRWFAQVIAVEPDPQMAANLADLHASIRVQQTTAEDYQQEPESADLVTSGTAFYWMDGPRVLARIHSWLHPSGVLAIYRYRLPRTPHAVGAVIRRQFELYWDRFRHERLRDEDYSRRTLAAAPGFGPIEAATFHRVVRATPHQVVGFWSSTSYVSAYLRTLPEPGAYLQELETSFQRAHPDDMIPMDFELELFLTRKG